MEREKMLRGEFYNPRDEALIQRYHSARRLMQEYNLLESTAMERRREILEELLGGVGPGVWIEAPFFCDYGENIFIGENTFVNVNCMFLDDNTITLGKNGLIAPYVQIYTALHPLKASERIVDTPAEGEPVYRTRSLPVTIGDNVWIGGNSVILPGVRIGHNVTIGAGSVVTKDVPEGVLALGNPCRVVRDLE